VSRTRKGSLVVALVVAAIAIGGATAVASVFWLHLHARLAPVSGTQAAGEFNGTLVRIGGRGPTPTGRVPVPLGSRWQLAWSLSLPKLDGTMNASLRIGSPRSSTRVTRVLCTRCSTTPRGTMTLKARQVRHISKAGAVVVVRAGSATLRGPVKVFVDLPATTKG